MEFKYECLGVVLAGGQSQRMGQNKAMLTLSGETLIQRSINTLQQCSVDKVIVSGANNGGDADLVINAGPLGGIYSIITKYRPQSLLVLPVDVPFMDAKHLQQLRIKGALRQKVTYFNDSTLPAFIPVNAPFLQFINDHFGHGQFQANSKGPSLRQAFSRAGQQSIALTNSRLLFNTNTPQQFEQAKLMLSDKPWRGSIE
ncbi:molybdenum cofactor guanylyltransferase [Thalassotalea ponticola]|uniref:molybdenum cofactor guanylyltransferase n=1 Tax=Thalassotalea ponticola TaxID=1523392 RepID=UPI0025B3CDDB|nr:molybdenum cofactor guanylyltransferase [Thalassotalea ponticola]MDN3651896.1 molybdenum cofactor guanylyltransferase [Thalassotalea ponticola]